MITINKELEDIVDEKNKITYSYDNKFQKINDKKLFEQYKELFDNNIYIQNKKQTQLNQQYQNELINNLSINTVNTNNINLYLSIYDYIFNHIYINYIIPIFNNTLDNEYIKKTFDNDKFKNNIIEIYNYIIKIYYYQFKKNKNLIGIDEIDIFNIFKKKETKKYIIRLLLFCKNSYDKLLKSKSIILPFIYNCLYNVLNFDKYNILKLNINFSPSILLYFNYDSAQPYLYDRKNTIKINDLDFICYRITEFIYFNLKNNYKLFNMENYEIKKNIFDYCFDLLSIEPEKYLSIIEYFNFIEGSIINLKQKYIAFSNSYENKNYIYTINEKTRKNEYKNDYYMNYLGLNLGLTQENVKIIINLIGTKQENYLCFHNKKLINNIDDYKELYYDDNNNLIFKHYHYEFDKNKINYKQNYLNENKEFILNDFEVISYLNWPDGNVPKSLDDFYKFILYVYELEQNVKGNISVHCEAGIGRTGTFILCYDIFKHYQEELNEFKSLSLIDRNKIIDKLIIDLFINIRNQRMRTIQTITQLEFIKNFINYLII